MIPFFCVNQINNLIISIAFLYFTHSLPMGYRKITIYALPGYFILTALLVSFGTIHHLHRYIVTSLFGAVGLACGIILIYELKDFLKTYLRLYFCRITNGKTKKSSEKTTSETYESSLYDLLNISRKRATLISIMLPVVMCAIVTLVVTFTVKENIRYYEYMSIYVNYSAPIFISLLFASVKK